MVQALRMVVAARVIKKEWEREHDFVGGELRSVV